MDIYGYLQQNFKLITREEYRKCNLPDNTKKILCDTGLPDQPLDFIQFNITDARALSNEENWWPVILEQIRY